MTYISPLVGFTIQGPWIWLALIGGVCGVFYEIWNVLRLINYKLTGHRCTGFVQQLETVKMKDEEKTVLRMEYYNINGERVIGVQEDLVKLEKPLIAEAKYKPGDTYEIITGGKFPGRYVLVHRFYSSMGWAFVRMLGFAVLALVMAKLCIFGFNF